MKKLLLATVAIALSTPFAAWAQSTPQPMQGAKAVSLRDWNHDELYKQGWSVDEFIDDVEVHDPTGEEIGDVDNVLFDADGKVVAIIASVGGVWDIGDTDVSVPWSKVEFRAGNEEITIPVTEDTVDNFSLFGEGVITPQRAGSEVNRVDDDLNAPRIWKASELIGDYVRLSGGENYGYVRDIIVGQDGGIKSVIVTTDAGYGPRGYYAYPHYGYGYGYRPGLSYYGLPYARTDIERIDRFDYERMENRFED